MGKSTLLTQWARSQSGNQSLVWVTLYPATRGRYAFWRTVLDAILASGLAGSSTSLADVLPASLVAETLRASLARGFGALPEPLVIVIDDYQEVGDDEVDDDLIWLLARVPSLSVVLSTRDLASFSSSLTSSRVSVVVIDGDELTLTADEVTRLAETAGVASSAADVQASTRGWPMLVRAELLRLGDEQRGGPRRHRGLHGAVRDIATAVLEGGSADRAQFILQSSIADSVTVELAASLTGFEEATIEVWMAQLESAAVGTLHVDSGREVFRYLPLLREEFERMLQAQHPEQVRVLRAAFALWLSAHGEALAASRQAALAGDWQTLDSVRSTHGSTLTMTSPVAYLELLRSIPDDVLLRYPGLQLSKSLLSVRKDRRLPATVRQIGGAIASIAAARNARDASQSELGRLWNLGIVMILHRLNGRADAAAAAAADVSRALDSLSPDDRDSANSYVALAHSHTAITYLHLGNDSEALHHAQRDLEAAEHYDNEWEALHAIALTCWALAAQGELVRAEPWLERARATTRPAGWKDSYIGTGYRIAEALVALERFDADAAEAHIRALDFHAPTIEHWPAILHVEGLIALTRGATRDGMRAVSAIAGARGRRAVFPHQQHLVASTRAMLAIALGDSAAAHASDHVDVSQPLPRVALARVALVEGKWERALLLAQLGDSERASARLTAEALVIKSIAALKLGAVSASVESLRDASVLMRRHGMRQPLALVPRAHLLEAAEALRAREGVELDLSDVPDRFAISRAVAELTKRELVVLAELATTANLDSIARRLVVSRNTVKGQVSSLYRKLGVTNRADALIVAFELGLVTAA